MLVMFVCCSDERAILSSILLTVIDESCGIGVCARNEQQQHDQVFLQNFPFINSLVPLSRFTNYGLFVSGFAIQSSKYIRILTTLHTVSHSFLTPLMCRNCGAAERE